MERDAEIAQIKHELEILRAHYALYGRWGGVLKGFLMVWTPLFAIGVLALTVKLFLFEVVLGGFFVAMMLVVAATPADLRPPFRWIDAVSPPPRFSAAPYTDFRSFLLRRHPSDAQMIEEQIAEREQRLMELGVPS